MKKVMVITKASGIAQKYAKQLQDFFQEDLIVDWIVDTDPNIKQIFAYDMLLLSSYQTVSVVQKYINPQSKVLKITKNVSPQGLKALDALPYGVTTLVVNVGPKTASESIHLIYSHGRTDLDLHPYYPGIEKVEQTDYIITQGEPVPFATPKQTVIDIFNTEIDVQVFLETLLYFELDRAKYMPRLFAQSTVNRSGDDGLSYMINEKYLFEVMINTLFENLNEGVIVFDAQKRVTSCSMSVQDMLGISKSTLFGRPVEELLRIQKYLGSATPVETVVHTPRGVLICKIISKVTIGPNPFGLVILKRYNEAEAQISVHRQAIIERGYQSKYRMEDVIGSSQVLSNLKDIALRMANSESTVLIIGESGTGKELFAHVLHNNSRRRNNQFVAINCPSIPETLLESELFGYEDGAFTGAAKGGKKGIFEAASGGTLFLDEIGEIPMHLQNRLLRVLQEKEVIRVGGTRIIPVDVRVITATNLDLRQQVEAGRFRKDLYYRLSVLPLNIPPLRKRGADVLEIFDAICDAHGRHISLSEEVRAFFLSYRWDGNIREVRNCAEYLISLGVEQAQISDLPDTMQGAPIPAAPALLPQTQTDMDPLILRIIFETGRSGRSVGRRQITAELARQNIFLGEQEVRRRLLRLAEDGCVSIGRGRQGTRLTPRGLEGFQKWY